MKKIGYKEAVQLLENFHIIKVKKDNKPKISVYGFDECAEEIFVGYISENTFDKLREENKIRYRRQEQGFTIYW